MRTLVDGILPSFVFLIMLITFLVISGVFFYLKRKFKAHKTQNISSLLVGTLTGFYSIFLGFVIYLLWSDYQNAQVIVVDETTKLYVLFESSKDFPPQVAQTIHHDLVNYISIVLNDEWPAMREGKENLKGHQAINKLYNDLINYRPEDSVSRIYYQEALLALNAAIEDRNHRLNMLNLSIPTAWYIMIFLGAFSVIIMGIYIIRDNFINFLMHLFLCVFLAFYVAAVTVVSYPFSGVISVTNEPFKKLLFHIQSDPTD